MQLTSAFYKSIRGGDDAKEELYKQLAALEKELKERNTKFIGGELLSIILIQIGLSILPVLPMLEETGNMTIWLIVWKIKKNYIISFSHLYVKARVSQFSWGFYINFLMSPKAYLFLFSEMFISSCWSFSLQLVSYQELTQINCTGRIQGDRIRKNYPFSTTSCKRIRQIEVIVCREIPCSKLLYFLFTRFKSQHGRLSHMAMAWTALSIDWPL